MIRSEVVNTTINMKITMIQVINYLIKNMINSITELDITLIQFKITLL
jgi:hypothetical protein